MPTPAYRWITTQAELIGIGQALEQAAWVALDTEANSMWVYRERMCLIQLNIGGDLVVVDTLALFAEAGWEPGTGPAACLAPLKAGLERTDRPLWLHGGEYDCAMFRRDAGISLGGVWDTQQAASFLGWDKTSYGAVVERICGIALEKAFSQYDWGTRPLDPDALAYALDDVVHLPAVAEHLRAAIAEADLVEEHAIANTAVAASNWDGGYAEADFWWMKDLRELSRDRLPVAFALYRWRDQLARAANKPPGRMINGEQLHALARHAPTNFQLLKRTGAKSWFLSQHGDDCLNLIKDALANPPQLPPQPERRDVDDLEKRRETRLKDWRRAESERRKVPLQVVLPAKALEFLKRYGATDLSAVPQLGAKRAGVYGAKLVELCR